MKRDRRFSAGGGQGGGIAVARGLTGFGRNLRGRFSRLDSAAEVARAENRLPRMLFTARPAPDGSRSFLFMGMHQSLGAFSLVTVEGHEASRGVDDPVRKLQILLLSQQRQSFFAG